MIKELREKEQESKIATTRLREISKNVKHNSLTPMGSRGGEIQGNHSVIMDRSHIPKLRHPSERNKLVSGQYSHMTTPNSPIRESADT